MTLITGSSEVAGKLDLCFTPEEWKLMEKILNLSHTNSFKVQLVFSTLLQGGTQGEGMYLKVFVFLMQNNLSCV